MAKKTTKKVGDYTYKTVRITRTVGKKMNEDGFVVPIKKEFTGKTKKEAEAKYQSFMEKKSLGIEDKKQYFGILADNWLNNFFVNDSRYSNRTKKLYLDAWNKYFRPLPLYNLPLEEISANTLQKAYNTMPCPASAVKKIHNLLKPLYMYFERESLARNVTNSLVLPKDDITVSEKTIDVWTDEEARIILNSFDKADTRFRLRFFIVLAYFTGARVSELLAITYDDFTEEGLKINKQISQLTDFKTNETTLGIDIPKTSSSHRTIPLASDVITELEIHRKWQQREMLKNGYRTRYLFTTDTGNFINRHNVTHALNRYYKRIGIEPKGVHCYRHTFATNLVKNGVPIQTASNLLGHSDIGVTAKYYTNISIAEKREAVEMLVGIINK